MAKQEIRKKESEFKATKEQLIDKEFSFTVYETTHSKTIKSEHFNIFFSDDMRDFNELALINMTKNDARKYCDLVEVPKTTSKEIEWFYMTPNGKEIFDKFKKFDHLEVYKIDLSAAYWNHAMNMNIISQKTINHFLKNEDHFINGSKPARLKALGSLATRKLVTDYELGRAKGSPRLVQDEVLRNLYMNVCKEVDDVMKAVALRYDKNCIYYYWDCLFLNAIDLDILEVQKFIKECGFNSKFDKSIITINSQYDFSVKDVNSGVNYPLKKEQVIN